MEGRMARRTWTDNSVASLKFGSKRRPIPDPQIPGHYVRGRDGGPKSYYATARDPQGKQHWHCIGRTEIYSLEQSREAARTAIQSIRAGRGASSAQTFAA